MKLNGATIENMTIGSRVFNDNYEFIKALKSARNILADVYLEGHLVGVGHVTFSEDSGWLTAGLNVRFSLDAPTLVNSVIIKVYDGGYKDTMIMSTSTPTVNEYIEAGDQNAELRFTVMSVHPYNSWRRPSNTSRISWLRTHLIQPAHLDDLPTQGNDIIVDDPVTP